MADDVLDGAPEGAAEVTDLRSTIRAAVEAQRTSEPESVEAPEPEAIEPEKVAKSEKTAAPETEAERNERLRDDKGKFATEKNAVKPEPKLEIVKTDGEAKLDADGKAVVRAPESWSPTAKVAFATLPAEVQQAVVKREEEVARGFENYQRFKPIQKYDDMARQSGTTLDRALENYVGIETELKRDFVAGVSRICQNQGINPIALANEILARNGGSPQPGASGEADPQQVRNGGPQPANIDLAPVMQKISALENYFQQQQTATVQTEIQRFASDPKHTFFENVKADMGRLINSGQSEDMEDAYDKACWANKEIRALLIKQQSPVVPSANAADAVQKAKAAAKATGGAPSVGFTPNPGTAGASIRDTIRAAVNAQRGI